MLLLLLFACDRTSSLYEMLSRFTYSRSWGGRSSSAGYSQSVVTDVELLVRLTVAGDVDALLLLVDGLGDDMAGTTTSGLGTIW